MRTALMLAMVCATCGAGWAAAQERLPIGAQVGAGAPSGAPSGYDEAGRRDPFVSLIVTKKTTPTVAPGRVVAGLSGVALADVAVKGIIHNGATMQAVLEGPGGKSFIARGQDRLQDAFVKSIDAGGVVFAEQVVDVLGVAHTKDVRKALRPTEGEK